MNTILFAYRTEAVPDLTIDLSAFPPPANYKNEDAIARWRAEFAAKAAVSLAQQPFTGKLAEVHLSDLANQDVAGFKEDVNKKPLCQRVRSWLLSKYKWSTDYRTEEPPPARFVGFNPKGFLRMLAHECALPQNNQAGSTLALPISMWSGNLHNVDIESLFISSEDKYLAWPIVLQRHNLLDKFGFWPGPGVKPAEDLELTVWLGTRIGLFLELTT